ncbi:hypothetical protein SGUI_1130 [Serinicoccus hydrothermalis]|uniref:Uncharacterized protein n=2 Tax=Serinicoccus hydrothermalis TaxID=1758689 RepID=A0A1B1NAR9_9MICO|nr:hypothetical protein SGUI_1130 [Serinicoccus hydrothermalis]
MLTGDTASATRLTGLTLAQAPPDADAQELRRRLVRTFVRTAPRRRDKSLAVGTGDPGDVVARLSPRARAAAVLRLVEGASVADVATALRIAPDKVARLVPDEEGVDVALEALAHRYALPAEQLERELGTAVAQAPPEPPSRDRRWWWVAAAAVPLAVLGGYALSLGRDEPAGTDEAAPTGGGSAQVGSVDLTEAGFELDDGEPPRGAAGLTRMDTVEVSSGESAGFVLSTVDARFGGQVSSFGVLWCDMPPADDPALEPPVGEVTVGGSTLTLPCAGTSGEPAVGLDHVVALPASGRAEIRISGDLPPEGRAVLGVYGQTDDIPATPLPRGDLTAGLPVPPDAVVVDEAGTASPYGWGERVVQPVELSADSTIRVWSGSTGAVSVLVDGITVTDDGDLEAWAGGRPDWRDQQPDVRDGRWMVYVPGTAREFPVPEDLLPGDGEQRSVVVEAVADSTDHLQVVATGAAAGTSDRSPVARTDAPDAPEYVSGHRLVAAWDLPMDGVERELLEPPERADTTWALRVPEPEGARGAWLPFVTEGGLRDGEWLRTLWTAYSASDVSSAFQDLGWGGDWVKREGGRIIESDESGQEGPTGEPDLHASAPASPGHPPALLLAYEPVAYEDFDFAAAQLPATSWPPDEVPPWPGLSDSPVATVTSEDLGDDGRTTVTVPNSYELGARIATEGQGRIRFQVDGGTVDQLQDTQGWWSSWTDREVVSQAPLFMGIYELDGELELTITVEDYEDVTIELFRN